MQLLSRILTDSGGDAPAGPGLLAREPRGQPEITGAGTRSAGARR